MYSTQYYNNTYYRTVLTRGSSILLRQKMAVYVRAKLFVEKNSFICISCSIFYRFIKYNRYKFFINFLLEFTPTKGR